MRVIAAAIVLGLLLIGATEADEQAEEQASKPLTPEQAADQVLEVFQAGDQEALKALAEKDTPDPWLVADELCFLGEHDAAEAFSKAAPRKAVEELPKYVASRRGEEVDEQARRALAVMIDLLGKEAWQRVLDTPAEAKVLFDSVVRVRIAYSRGLALRGLRKRKESVEVLTEAGSAARRLGWLSQAAVAFHEAAMSASWDSDWRTASSAWMSRLELKRELGDRAGIAHTLKNIGSMETERGRYAAALPYFHESLGLFRGLGDREGMAGTLVSIGRLQWRQGNCPAALESYDEALKLFRDMCDRDGIATTLGNIGCVQRGLGNYTTALRSHHEALKFFRERGNKFVIAITLDDIGRVHQAAGNYSGALRYYNRSLRVSREWGDKAGIARTLGNIGGVHRRLGNYSVALRNLSESLEIKRELGKAGLADTLMEIGNVYRVLDKYPQALRRFEEAWRISRDLGDMRGIAWALSNIGLVQGLLEDYPEAISVLKRSREMHEAQGDKLGVTTDCVNLGYFHSRSGSHTEALEEYERARHLLAEAPSRDLQAHVSWGLAESHLHEGQPGRALRVAREGVESVSALSEGLADEQGAIARDVFLGVFDVGYRAAVRAGQLEDLLWLLEQGRAASLREGLGSRSALEAAVIPAELRQKLVLARLAVQRSRAAFRQAEDGGNRKAIRLARKALDAGQAYVGRVEEQIQREAKHTASVVLPDPDDIDDIEGYLKPGEVLLLFGLTSEGGVALVIRTDAARMIELPSSEVIQAAADALLDNDTQHIVPEATAELRRLLIEPLELRSDDERVLVSPTGRLGYIPFTLLFPDREVVYVPSGTTYGLLLEEREKRGEKVLGLGDPDYRTVVSEASVKLHLGANWTRLPPLPGTREEVRAVADIGILDTHATEAGFQSAVEKQERWRAIHFACHGLVDPERPMLSSLALTATKDDDGFLTCLDIFRMKIPADLVVLSACETGKGKIYQTEGIVGLTRAFMFAGAPRVICSLWKVDDEATQALMIKFYELWNPKEGKGLGAAAALKKAQEYIRDHADHPEWKHPYYWAAWVLWGLPD